MLRGMLCGVWDCRQARDRQASKSKRLTLDGADSVAHNPSGVDPTEEQWKKIADLCEAKKAIPIFDTAYQVLSPSRTLPHPSAPSRALPRSPSELVPCSGERLPRRRALSAGVLPVLCVSAPVTACKAVRARVGLGRGWSVSPWHARPHGPVLWSLCPAPVSLPPVLVRIPALDVLAFDVPAFDVKGRRVGGRVWVGMRTETAEVVWDGCAVLPWRRWSITRGVCWGVG